MTKVSEEGMRIVKEAAVLLISQHKNDFQALESFGFEKIDFFKSKIRALDFFCKNPEHLRKYNLIILGPQVVDKCTMIYDLRLLAKLEDVRNAMPLILRLGREACVYGTPLYKLQSDDAEDVLIQSVEYEDLISKLVKHLESINFLQKYEPLSPWASIANMILSTDLYFSQKTVNKIKILYLGNCDKDILNFGANVEYIKDHEGWLKCGGAELLGKYDIIIASRKFSKELAHLGIEASEQCKASGRALALLVTYQLDNIYHDTQQIKVGTSIRLRYTFGGPAILNEEPINEIINVSKKEELVILQKSIKIYASLYKKFGGHALDTSSLARHNQYEKEFKDKVINSSANFVNIEELITKFKDVQIYTQAYLEIKPNCFGDANHLPSGVEVYFDGRAHISAELYEAERLVGYLKFPRFSKRKKELVFSMQFLYEDGSLSVPTQRSLYIGKNQGVESMSNTPTEYELRKLMAILNIIFNAISQVVTVRKNE